MPNKGQTFDSSGPDTRVRGNAYQVLEKYLQLARDAGTAGDRVAAENFLQHADHYYRVVAAMNEGQRPRIGGREISVADVNVQNVSQGLSAALSGHGHSTGEDHQGEPGEQQHRSGGNGQARPQQQSQPQGGGNHGSGNHGGGNPESHNTEGGSDGQPAHSSGDASSETGGDGSFTQVDEQPDYPEDLLPGDAQAGGASDGQGQGGQHGGQGQGGQGQGDRQHGRMGRGRRRGPGRRIRNDGDDTPPPPSNPENA